MTRLTILTLVTLALTGCQRTTPPTSPTGLTFDDVEGAYTLKFTADESCDRLPRDVRSRTYSATVTRSGPRNLTAQLGGSTFYRNYDAFFIHAQIGGIARFNLSSLFAYDRWLEDVPIFERLPSGGSLSIGGVADLPFDRSGAPASIPFNGTFAHCASPTEGRDPFPPDCAAPVVCTSSTHTLAVTRR